MTDAGKIVASGTAHTDVNDVTHRIVLKTEQELRGIAETEELIAFVNDLADYFKRVMADGKFEMAELLGAITLSPSAWTGVSGSQLILPEFIHASGEERDQIFRDVFAAVMNLARAFTHKA